MLIRNGRPSTRVGQTVSHYCILEKLGGGGMGIVYKAEYIYRANPFLRGVLWMPSPA